MWRNQNAGSHFVVMCWENLAWIKDDPCKPLWLCVKIVRFLTDAFYEKPCFFFWLNWLTYNIHIYIYIYIFTHTHTHTHTQSNQNLFRHLQHFSHYITVYSLVQKMVIKYDKNSELKLCQNKFILIMSDNVDRKLCNGLQSNKKYPAVKFKGVIGC